MATKGIDEEISEEDIEKIARKYLTEWERLRPHLKLSHVQAREIRKSHPGDFGEQKREFLWTWKEGEGSDATYGAFIQAAKEAGMKKLADSVRALIRQGRVSDY